MIQVLLHLYHWVVELWQSEVVVLFCGSKPFEHLLEEQAQVNLVEVLPAVLLEGNLKVICRGSFRVLAEDVIEEV